MTNQKDYYTWNDSFWYLLGYGEALPEAEEKTKTQRHLVNKQIKNTKNFKLNKLDKVDSNKLLHSMIMLPEIQGEINHKTYNLYDDLTGFENKITTKNRRQRRIEKNKKIRKSKHLKRCDM